MDCSVLKVRCAVVDIWQVSENDAIDSGIISACLGKFGKGETFTVNRPMRYYIVVYCFGNTSFLSFDCRQTLYLTSQLEGYLALNKSQLFVLVESVWILGQELPKVEEKGNEQASTNLNKQCWGRKVENRERFGCIEAVDCQGGCGLEQKQVSG